MSGRTKLIGAVAIISSGTLGGGAAPATPTSSYTAKALRPGEEKILSSYGWVDQKNDIARIPISRAIDIVAQKGLPARPASAAPAGDEDRTAPSYSSSGTQETEWLH